MIKTRKYAKDNSQIAKLWNQNAKSWVVQSEAGKDVYRDQLNTPRFLEYLPEIQGMSGLDIGCGDGTNTRLLANKGAIMTGIDIAENFISHAQAKEVENQTKYLIADACALPFKDSSFSFATAFMSMMDICKPDIALKECFHVLKPGGFFQFSILHPCFVPPTRKNIRNAKGETMSVSVADYFLNVDGRIEEWHFPDKTKTSQ